MALTGAGICWRLHSICLSKGGCCCCGGGGSCVTAPCCAAQRLYSPAPCLVQTLTRLCKSAWTG